MPGDETQKIYVWFDALNIYMTGVGFGTDEKKWKKWWPANLHIIGKDIVRFHAVYWPAILLAAGLPLPRELLVHGFITSGGRKMSKTIGNVIDPYEVIEKYGVEATRYYLLSQIPTLDDGDFTLENFEQVYQADLANGLGNLVARVAAMAWKSGGVNQLTSEPVISKKVAKYIESYSLNLALEDIWGRIREADKFINERQVWTLEGSELKEALKKLVIDIRQIAVDLKSFLPETAEKIEEQYSEDKIQKGEALFPRLE